MHVDMCTHTHTRTRTHTRTHTHTHTHSHTHTTGQRGQLGVSRDTRLAWKMNEVHGETSKNHFVLFGGILYHIYIVGVFSLVGPERICL